MLSSYHPGDWTTEKTKEFKKNQQTIAKLVTETKKSKKKRGRRRKNA